VACCELLFVQTEHIKDIWPKVSGFIAEAVHKLELSDFGILEKELFEGKALLWIALDGEHVKAASVTQITIVNGRKYCTIIALGGQDRDEWMPLISGLEQYARDMNCKAMRIFGRLGWSRVLPDYKIVGHISERTLQ